jgi:ABC-type Fe2+-enterobactin transport system substrate-binding protein
MLDSGSMPVSDTCNCSQGLTRFCCSELSVKAALKTPKRPVLAATKRALALEKELNRTRSQQGELRKELKRKSQKITTNLAKRRKLSETNESSGRKSNRRGRS